MDLGILRQRRYGTSTAKTINLWFCWERTDHVDPSVDLPTNVFLHRPDRGWARTEKVKVKWLNIDWKEDR